MDPFSVYPTITNPEGHHLLSFESPASPALDAQPLLQQIGWTYYTIWELEAVHLLTGRACWSRGDVNRSFAGRTKHDQHRDCEMGFLLQKFYQQCRVLPLGSSGIAGVALASRQYQWASGNALSQQINALSRHNQTPAPLALQFHGFQTIVCIPLQNSAGILEIGTTELVPKSDGIIFQLLKFTNTLDTQLGPRCMLISPPSLNIGKQHCAETADEHTMGSGYPSNEIQTYGSTITREPSISSSYHSSSSPNSSSPSLEQTTNATMQTMLSQQNSFNSNEEKLISPVSSGQTPPMNMLTSFDQLDILNEMGHIDTLCGRSSVSMPSFNLEIDNMHHGTSPFHFDHGQQHVSDSRLFNSYLSLGSVGTSLHQISNRGDGKVQPASGGSRRRSAFREWRLTGLSRLQKPRDMKSENHLDIVSVCSTLRMAYKMNAEATQAAARRAFTPPVQPLGADQAATAAAGSSCNIARQNDSVVNEAAAKQHMFAERNRRRRQGDCLTLLRKLVPNITKVPKSNDIISSPLKFTNTLGTQLGSRCLMISPPNLNIGKQHCAETADEHSMGPGYPSNEIHTYEGRITREPSMSSSYHSSYSPSSSSPSLEQTTNATMQTMLSQSPAQNSFNSNEEIFISPVGSGQTPPMNMVSSFDQLDILNEMGHSDTLCGRSSASMPSFNLEIDNMQYGTTPFPFDHGQQDIWDSRLFNSDLSLGNVDTDSSMPRSVAEYMLPQHHHTLADGLVFKSTVVEPLQGVGNINIDQVKDASAEELSTSPGHDEQLTLAAKHHMFAERNRRRRQGDCLTVLRTLVPNITKRDKVTTLERTIEYVKQMQSLVHDLEQQKNSFQKSNATDFKNIKVGLDNSQNINDTVEGSQSLLKHATCEFHHSSRDQHFFPHFELELSIKLKDEDANACIINIITGLQQKNLQCIDLKTEFHPVSSNLSAKVLAQYKVQDEENYIPAMAEIQSIKQWWINHIENFSK